jgi:4-amino-4-deoxy-L-arabinose transferase-like glycosyltransferase
MTRQSTTLLLFVVVALALGLRLLLWSQPLHEPANDEVEYIAVAQDLLAGRGWVFYDSYRWLRAPLYPLFLAASLWLSGGDLHRAALPNIVISVVNVLLAYHLTLALFGARRRVALLAALLTAVLWTNVTFASLYMSETLFTFLFQGGLLALLHVTKGTTSEASMLRWRLVALAGLLFALATLTRSITLLFLPVLALWFLLSGSAEKRGFLEGLRPSKPRLGMPLVFLVTATLVIAPWTVRNTLAYGAPIVVETGLAYNLWAFNEPRESLSEIHRRLEAIPNPVARSEYATERGMERLREDPGIVARKLWPNWVFLARVKPIQDRFLLQSYYATVELPLFATALLFDDLLYLVIVLAATAALVRRPHWLVLAWIGYCVLTMLLTHGEARYRHFLFPVLVPAAAVGLVGLKEFGRSFFWGRSPQTPAPQWQVPLVVVLWAVFLWTVGTSYPWDWAAENLARGWHTLAGDVRGTLGDREGALREYERAIEAYNVPDAWLRLGHARRAGGDLAGAAEAYRRAWRREPLYYPASTWYGDAQRELGNPEEARRGFAGSFADARRMTEYAWRELHAPPPALLDVGDGLDYGFVSGVEPSEQLAGATARWTNGHARFRLAAQPGSGVLRLRLAAPRPDGERVTTVACVLGVCYPLQLDGEWRTYEIPIQVDTPGGLDVELRSNTFRAADGRELGVLVDWMQKDWEETPP